MFPTDILTEIQVSFVQSLHKMNVPNGSHFGRVSGQSCAESAQDEATILPCCMIFVSWFWLSFFMAVLFNILTSQFIFG